MAVLTVYLRRQLMRGGLNWLLQSVNLGYRALDSDIEYIIYFIHLLPLFSAVGATES